MRECSFIDHVPGDRGITRQPLPVKGGAKARTDQELARPGDHGRIGSALVDILVLCLESAM